MPLLLRQIRKSKWFRSQEVNWLADGELQADALGDIRTSNNSLSVWEIADDQRNLDAVVTALAAGRNAAANFDFALFKTTAVLEREIKITETPGETFDARVNDFHRELNQLSTGKLLAIAEIIQRQAKRERVMEPKILSLIANAIQDGRFKFDILAEHIRSKLQK